MKTDELKRLAELATPGPWENCRGFVRRPLASPHAPLGQLLAAEKDGSKMVVTTSTEWVAECTQGEAFYNGENNANYIAAASPAVVLELIQQLEAANRDAERYRWLKGHPARFQDIWFSTDDLDAAIDAAMKP